MTTISGLFSLGDGTKVRAQKWRYMSFLLSIFLGNKPRKGKESAEYFPHQQMCKYLFLSQLKIALLSWLYFHHLTVSIWRAFPSCDKTWQTGRAKNHNKRANPCNPYFTNENRNTPLQDAVEWRNLGLGDTARYGNIVKVLLDKGDRPTNEDKEKIKKLSTQNGGWLEGGRGTVEGGGETEVRFEFSFGRLS